MEWHASPSDYEDEDDDQEEQKMPHEHLGGDERRRQQLQQASSRSRKRQKRESMLAASEISVVRHEIAAYRDKLDAALQSSSDHAAANQHACEHLELTQRVGFLRGKLEAHRSWMVNLRNLLASAPLLDYALRMRETEDHEGEEEQGDEATQEHTTQESENHTMLNEWRQQDSGGVFSPILVAKHVHASVAMSQDNVFKLLNEFDDPECDFSVRFSARGWSHAAHVDDKLLTFRSSRVVPFATAKIVAMAVWRSLQYDDILRTFVPIVQDVVTVYDAETPQRLVMERVVQFETSGPPDSVATIESMQKFDVDSIAGWQLAVETCDDPCLIAFASERIAAASTQSPTPSSPVLQAAGHNLTSRPDFVVAARCFDHVSDGGDDGGSIGGSGAMLQFAGSVRHDGAWLVHGGSALELVQYLVCIMPVYEELHLLSKTQSDTG